MFVLNKIKKIRRHIQDVYTGMSMRDDFEPGSSEDGAGDPCESV